MFNLEKSIGDWRQQMLGAGINSPVPLDELETHLREEVAQLAKSGRSDAEAFEIAVQKIGQAQLLRKEFKKTDEAEKARMEERGLRFVVALMNLFFLGVGGAVFFKAGSFSQCSSGQQISCLVAVAISLLPNWCLRLTWRILPVVRVKRTRDAIGVSGGVLLALWMIVLCRAIMPRFDFTVGQLLVLVLWAMVVPLGLFAGVAFGIEGAARKKLETASS